MNRFQKITSMIDTSGRGLEIGPSHNPVMPKRNGYNVETVDHLDQSALVEKYQGHGVDTSLIESVDYIWSGEPLSELIGEEERYDWIIASHVIEHVTDVIGFLQQCLKLLKKGGTISLVVPDRRYCFDYLRFPSSTGAMLQAHLEMRSRHSPGQLFDYVSTVCKVRESIAWDANAAGPTEFVHGLEQAKKQLADYVLHRNYFDLHGWVFTPSSFKLAIHDFNALGLVEMKEVSHFPPAGSEFYFSYRPVPESIEIDRLHLCKSVLEEIINNRLS